LLRDKPPGGLRSQRDSSPGQRVRYAYDRAGDLTVTLGLSDPFTLDTAPWGSMAGQC